MIQINIICDGEKILDRLDTKETTLVENAVVLRRLEEIKQKLLSVDYQSDIDMEDIENES